MAKPVDAEPGSPKKRRLAANPDPAPISTSTSGNPFAGVSLFSAASVAGAGVNASNPFAGIPAGSLFASPSSGGLGSGGFAAAAAAVAGASSSFTKGSFSAGGSSFLESGASGGSAEKSNGNPGNPFTGLSLFSSPPAGNNLFAAAPACSNSEPPASSETVNAKVGVAGSASSSAFAADAASAPTGAGNSKEPAEGDAAEDSGEDAVLVEGETGEEEEEVVFRGESKLWKLVSDASVAGAGDSNQKASDAVDAPADAKKHSAAAEDAASKPAEKNNTWRWQERACGVVHINRHKKTGAGRLVMRMRGVGKLVLNTPAFPTGKYERVGQKTVRFLGVDVDAEAGAGAANSPKEVSLCSYRSTFQHADQQREFLRVLRERLQISSAV